MKKKLSHKQLRFVDEFMYDQNKGKAAVRAGYSKNNSAAAGLRLYKDPWINAEINERMKGRQKRTGIDSDYVLRRLGEIDQLDCIDILDQNGDLLPIIKWPKVWRISISGFDVSRIGHGDDAEIIKKIKWPDKVKNLDMIGKHITIGAWGEKEDETGKGSDGAPIIYIVELPDNGR